MVQFKGVVRISSVVRFGVHGHPMLPNVQTYTERDRLQLNHYRIQSKEYFRKVKMTRGDVAKEEWNLLRTWDYFHDVDRGSSKCVDRELCSILGCCES